MARFGPTFTDRRGRSLSPVGRLEEKVALISGSARGQGEAEARLFVREGARVVVSDILDDQGRALAGELGGAATYVHLDVTSEQDWARAVGIADSSFGRLDVLVNNAGIGIPPHPLLDATIEGHTRTIDVNLHGVWMGMRAAAPALRRAGGGSIVNISSIDGLVGVAGMASYTASKFAVTGLTKSAALEWGRDGIRVNSVHPGVISSPMVEQAPPEVLARLQQYLDHQPIPRMGTPEEVALLVLYLASDESSYCTGSEFVIDGGHIAGPWREPPH
jgi:3alpha(or 20beta)-hydroxysteroid dehydrogenase